MDRGSLVDYSLRGHKESDRTEQLTLSLYLKCRGPHRSGELSLLSQPPQPPASGNTPLACF